MLLKTYKHKKRIICYISKYNSNFTDYKDKFVVSTGKPSDRSCLAWQYTNLKDAEKTANEYFNNYTETPF